MREFQVDRLNVQVYESRQEMGRQAALQAAEHLRALLREQEAVRAVFAAAPSQTEFLQELCAQPGIDWKRVQGFHMDEYEGLGRDRAESFGRFLAERVFDRLPFGAVEYINGTAEDMEAECLRYAGLLDRAPIDVVFLGIGENGHIAFNDPAVADFHDGRRVKLVELDQVCRQQQVNDKCFQALEQVPRRAVTLTVPTLFEARRLFCVVPAASKAWAVRHTLLGPVSEACPASILRRHPAAALYLDEESAAMLS